jgi:hypothetical protein
MAAFGTATIKKAIVPVKIVIEVTVSRVNENGTFSGIEVTKVTSPVKDLDGLRVACPPQGGGSMYLKVDSIKGLTLKEGAATPSVSSKVKLF